MLCDTLYMGYYIHLAEDLVYRDFIYNRYKWSPMENGRLSQKKVDGLHNDYRLLNKYVKEKYNLKNDIKIPHDIAEEELFRAFPMNVTDFMRSLSYILMKTQRARRSFSHPLWLTSTFPMPRRYALPNINP